MNLTKTARLFTLFTQITFVSKTLVACLVILAHASASAVLAGWTNGIGGALSRAPSPEERSKAGPQHVQMLSKANLHAPIKRADLAQFDKENEQAAENRPDL